jgi:uncharacterized protein (DUF885 family)
MTNRLFWVLTAASLMKTSIPAAALSQSVESRPLKSLLEEDWQWRLKNMPEFATLVGERRYNDRLTDLSPEAIEYRRQHVVEMLRRLGGMDRQRLKGQDALSYDLFLYEQQLARDGQRFPLELLPLDQLDGPHLTLPALVGFMPFENSEDYERYLARLHAIPPYLEQVTALLKRGIKLRWVQPRGPLGSIPDQIQGQLVADVKAGAFFSPFKNIPMSVRSDEQKLLTAAARKVIGEEVLPALAQLRAFVQKTYL